jgi:hypothetical protein
MQLPKDAFISTFAKGRRRTSPFYKGGSEGDFPHLKIQAWA